MNSNFSLSCPIPLNKYPHVLLAHGGGGKLMHNLIKEMFAPLIDQELLEQQHDSALLELPSNRIAMTTDSYVVSPLFFPGGDIGCLAIDGTVNDLAVSGTTPLYITLSFILEEGLAMETLWQIVKSISAAAKKAKVKIVTGDTKVVEKGKGDGIFINTAGLGLINPKAQIAPNNIKVGDAIILSNDIGRHGIAILAKREGLEFETEIESDVAPLGEVIQKLINSDLEVHCMRDLTRGGLASALVELSEQSQKAFKLDESAIVVNQAVKGACEMLGLDPLFIANEGAFVAFVAKKDAEQVIEVLKAHPECSNAAIIGEVSEDSESIVSMTNLIGTNRIIDMISGEQLPRIC